MKGYAALPDAAVADDGRIDAWIREALDYTATLPTKQPKAKKPR
jgi:TfoX/Sxy family transcriptional regulator of competence genes